MLKWTNTEYSYPYWVPTTEVDFIRLNNGRHSPAHLLTCQVTGEQCPTTLQSLWNTVLGDIVSGVVGVIGAGLLPGVGALLGGAIGTTLNNRIQNAIANKLDSELTGAMNDAINEMIKAVGIDEYFDKVDLRAYVEQNTLNDLANIWVNIMSEPNDAITKVHGYWLNYAFQFLLQPSWYNQFINNGNFGNDDLSKKYYFLMIAVNYFIPRMAQDMLGGGNPPPMDRKFFLDDGVSYYIASLTNGYNPTNAGHRSKIMKLCRLIGSLKIESNKSAYDQWKNQQDQTVNDLQKQGETQSAKNNSAFALAGALGALAVPFIKKG